MDSLEELLVHVLTLGKLEELLDMTDRVFRSLAMLWRTGIP